MTPERLALPGLILTLVAAMLWSMGAGPAFAAVPLGLGVALIVLAVHEALVELGSRK